MPSDPPSIFAEKTRISSLTSIANNIYILSRECRQIVPPIISHTLLPAERAAHHEASFMASLLSNAAVVFLHTASITACFYPCGVDRSSIVPNDAIGHVREASQRIYEVLRESLSTSNTASPYQRAHSPFFGCSQLLAATGSLLALESSYKSPHEHDIRRLSAIALSTDFELSESVLRNQGVKWRCARTMADEIRALRAGLRGSIGEGAKNERIMMGID